MRYCPHDAPIAHAEYIPDVYAAIQALRQCGLVQISQTDEPFRRELNWHLANQIRQRVLPETPDAPDGLFYARFSRVHDVPKAAPLDSASLLHSIHASCACSVAVGRAPEGLPEGIKAGLQGPASA